MRTIEETKEEIKKRIEAAEMPGLSILKEKWRRCLAGQLIERRQNENDRRSY